MLGGLWSLGNGFRLWILTRLIPTLVSSPYTIEESQMLGGLWSLGELVETPINLNCHGETIPPPLPGVYLGGSSLWGERPR